MSKIDLLPPSSPENTSGFDPLPESEPEYTLSAKEIRSLIQNAEGTDLGGDPTPVMVLGVRNITQLIAYIAKVLQSSEAVPVNNEPRSRGRIVIGPLEVDCDAYRVMVEGKRVHLTWLEMRLLMYLIENKGRARSRDDLLRDVWGYNPNVASRSPDAHVRRLRAKLGSAQDLIQTVRGMGYRLSAELPL